MFSNSKNNRLNNRDFNIDQNNHDYDFFHNRAAPPCTCSGSAVVLHISKGETNRARARLQARAIHIVSWPALLWTLLSQHTRRHTVQEAWSKPLWAAGLKQNILTHEKICLVYILAHGYKAPPTADWLGLRRIPQNCSHTLICMLQYQRKRLHMCMNVNISTLEYEMFFQSNTHTETQTHRHRHTKTQTHTDPFSDTVHV